VIPDQAGARGEAAYDNPRGHFASRGDVEALLPPDCGCPAVAEPVCGRDGVVYGNRCEAYCSGWAEVAGPYVDGVCVPLPPPPAPPW
jgi:hypothetical protein